MIEIRNVSKWYGPTQVLNGASTHVAKGEGGVVCGPSGSGKSTLIKCVNGLEPFSQGTITVDGISVGDPKTDLPKLRARVGMVFQHFELFPHMSVLQNLALAQVKVLGRDAAEAGRLDALRNLEFEVKRQFVAVSVAWRGVGYGRREAERACSWPSRTCSCWMSRPTIWTSSRWIGWRASWPITTARC